MGGEGEYAGQILVLSAYSPINKPGHVISKAFGPCETRNVL